MKLKRKINLGRIVSEGGTVRATRYTDAIKTNFLSTGFCPHCDSEALIWVECSRLNGFRGQVRMGICKMCRKPTNLESSQQVLQVTESVARELFTEDWFEKENPTWSEARKMISVQSDDGKATARGIKA